MYIVIEIRHKGAIKVNKTNKIYFLSTSLKQQIIKKQKSPKSQNLPIN